MTSTNPAALNGGEQVEWPYQHRLSVSFPTQRSARLVYATVTVDAELRPERVKRSCTLQDHVLSLSFAAADFQHLRVSVSSFMDTLILATRTLATFNDLSAERGVVGQSGDARPDGSGSAIH